MEWAVAMISFVELKEGPQSDFDGPTKIVAPWPGCGKFDYLCSAMYALPLICLCTQPDGRSGEEVCPAVPPAVRE